MTKRKSGGHPDLKMVNPNAAAVDIGSTMHMAAVNPDIDIMPVRAFGTFTQDLHDLADWFRSCGVTNVAMESTGVYWIPAFEILEAHGCLNCPMGADVRQVQTIQNRRLIHQRQAA